jgi:hypothetical protein
MQIQENFSTILKTDTSSVVTKAAELCITYPYFDIAHIANASHHRNDKNAMHHAALFVQNDMWLRYILYPEQFVMSIPQNTNAHPQKEAILIQQNNIHTEEKPVSVVAIEEKEPEDSNMAASTNILEHLTNDVEIIKNNNKISDAATILPKEPIVAPQKMEEVPATLPIIELEPYHTIDYFASQGIKLAPLLDTNDKLGQQLKSFTSWLKSMRKIDTVAGKETVEEKVIPDVKVASLAENSLQKEEIITETMAEVLVKQGKTNEAITLYEKLSLQDTEKSSYFASQIEKLKTV